MTYSLIQIYYDMLNDPGRPQWFKNALIEAFTENPDQAVRDAKELVAILEAKRDQVNKQKGESK